MKETFRSEYVKCGKPACRSCPHGPYWYAYRKDHGKTRKRYIGKDMPAECRRSNPHRLDTIFDRQLATSEVAREILGLQVGCTFAEARTAYRLLTLEHHPDRGGDCKTMARLSSSYSFLCYIFDWK